MGLRSLTKVPLSLESHDLDKDTAERVQEIMDDLGVDEDDAVEIEESL